jgi:Flp pilus assembly protein TadD
MQQALASILLLVLISVAAPSVRADDRADCLRGRGGERAIQSCTRALTAGRLSTSAKASVHVFRGMAFFRNSQYGQAIADFTQAIRINPQVDDYYYFRASTY